MDILWFDSLPSTQAYLIDALKAQTLTPPVCIGARLQLAGKGSRGNDWIGEEGNLFVSLALPLSLFPEDLKLESSSIYMAWLMREMLGEMGSKVWLKWPNDFYLGERKIGGVITNVFRDTLVCGIGINLSGAPEGYGKMDIPLSPHLITKSYCKVFENLPSWKLIFSKFRLEFENSRIYFTHHDHEKIALADAVLLEDGSLMCKGQRIFSLR